MSVIVPDLYLYLYMTYRLQWAPGGSLRYVSTAHAATSSHWTGPSRRRLFATTGRRSPTGATTPFPRIRRSTHCLWGRCSSFRISEADHRTPSVRSHRTSSVPRRPPLLPPRPPPPSPRYSLPLAFTSSVRIIPRDECSHSVN